MTFGADDKGVWQHYSHNSQFSGIWNKHGGGAHRGLHQAVEASQYVTGSQQRGPEKPLHETEKTEPGYWSCQHHGTSTKESCRHHGFTWERGHSGSRQHGWRIWLLICSHMLPDKLQVPDMELWGLGGVPPPAGFCLIFSLLYSNSSTMEYDYLLCVMVYLIFILRGSHLRYHHQSWDFWSVETLGTL